jgi:hypothetical protein
MVWLYDRTRIRLGGSTSPVQVTFAHAILPVATNATAMRRASCYENLLFSFVWWSRDRAGLIVAAFVIDDHTSVLIDGELAWADLGIVPATVLFLDEPAPASHVAPGKFNEVDFDNFATIEDCRFDHAGSFVSDTPPEFYRQLPCFF